MANGTLISGGSSCLAHVPEKMGGCRPEQQGFTLPRLGAFSQGTRSGPAVGSCQVLTHSMAFLVNHFSMLKEIRCNIYFVNRLQWATFISQVGFQLMLKILCDIQGRRHEEGYSLAFVFGYCWGCIDGSRACGPSNSLNSRNKKPTSILPM